MLVALDAVLAVTVGGGLLTRLRGRLSTELDDDATPSRSDGAIPTIRGASGGRRFTL